MTRDEKELLLVAAVFFGMFGYRKFEEWRGDPEADPDDPRRWGNTRVYNYRPPPGAKLP